MILHPAQGLNGDRWRVASGGGDQWLVASDGVKLARYYLLSKYLMSAYLDIYC